MSRRGVWKQQYSDRCYIGAGGNACVIVEHRNSKYAYKMLHADRGDCDYQRFREVAFYAHFTHPHIVKSYEVRNDRLGAKPFTLKLRLDRIKGDAFSCGKLSPQKVCMYASQLLSALSALHSVGVWRIVT